MKESTISVVETSPICICFLDTARSRERTRDNFLSAQQAVEYGLIDEVIAGRNIAKPA